MVLPAGSTLPPLPYLFGLLGGAIAVVLALRNREVTLRTDTVLALAPWMVVGSAFYALYQIDAVPGLLSPLFSSPTVYGTTAVLAGAAWVGVSRFDPTTRLLAAIGAGVAVAGIGLAIASALAAGTFAPGWSLIGATVALLASIVLWKGFVRFRPSVGETVGPVGALAVFGHVLDGVSTTIGVDVLGFGEQTPLSAILLDLGAALPSPPVVGSGWLFLLVKAGIAVGMVWLLADLVRDDPPVGNGLLLLITAVGFGPATHNLILFAVAGPAGL